MMTSKLTSVAADVRRRSLKQQNQNPPPYVGGYDAAARCFKYFHV